MAAVAALSLLGASCQADPGSVELRNQTDSHLLWVRGVPDRLAIFLESNTGFTTVAPGGQFQRQHMPEADPPEWCEPSNIANILLRPKNGQPLETADPIEVGLEDFDIVGALEPGHCWGETDAVWDFSG